MLWQGVCLKVLAVFALIAPCAAAANDAPDMQEFWWPLQQALAQSDERAAVDLIEQHERSSHAKATYLAGWYLVGGLEQRALQNKGLLPDDLLAAAERSSLPEWYRLDLMIALPMRQRFEQGTGLIHDAALFGSTEAQDYMAAAYEAGDRGLPANPGLAKCYRDAESTGKGVVGCVSIEEREGYSSRPLAWPLAGAQPAAATDPVWGTYLGIGDTDQVFDRALAEAERGNVSAQFRLAFVLLHADWFTIVSTYGYDRPREAMRWLRTAADGGVVGAIRELARSYRWGRLGLPQDREVADCFEQAEASSTRLASCRQMEKSKGYDQPAPTGRTVAFVSPLPAALRALAIAAYVDDPEFVAEYPDRDQRLEAIEKLGGVLVDIDDSGRPAAFFRRGGMRWDCGSIGCSVDVFMKSGQTWQRVGNFRDREAEFVVYDVKDNGAHRLQTYVDNTRRPVDIVWNGKSYRDPGDADLPRSAIVCDSPACP